MKKIFIFLLALVLVTAPVFYFAPSFSLAQTTNPTITAFSVSPASVILGGTVTFSGTASKGSSCIKQYRISVVGSATRTWTPATASECNSISLPIVTYSAVYNPNNFYISPDGVGSYTVAFDVQDTNQFQTGAFTTQTAPFTITNIPTLITPTISNLTTTSVTLGATITSLGFPASISARGTCWGTTPRPTTNCVATSGTTTGAFTQARTGFTPGNTYYYRGYATNSTGTAYSPDGTFSTSTSIPIVTTPTALPSTTSAILGATVTSLGLPASISARGTCLGFTADPSFNSPTSFCIAEGGKTAGVYSHTRGPGLVPGTTYHYRGYATNVIGTGYSGDATFTTTALPVLKDPTSADVDSTSATLGATVTSLGFPASISERGTCLGTSPAPTNCVASSGKTIGVYSDAQTGLIPGTQYFYRGYATNSTGTGYSPDGTFTTISDIPTVTTPTATSITKTSATLSANVTSPGVVIEGVPSSISERGICLGVNPKPTACAPEGGIVTGVYTQTKTGLTSGTTYYFRGYAKNLIGTGYSPDGTFTTMALPILTNPTVTSIDTTSATLGVNLTSGGFIIARGMCLWTTDDPTPNCVATTGTAFGVYTQTRTELIPGTQYFYHGYAVNNTGTGYSPDGTFTTKALPILTNPEVTSINTTSAIIGITLESLGIPASISARGTCLWTVDSTKPSCLPDSERTAGRYLQTRTGLTSGTLYHYYGYATNSTGTGYTLEDKTFTTPTAVPTIFTPTVTKPTVASITTTSATLGATLESSGIPASLSARGICLGTSPAPTNCVSSGTTAGAFTQSQTGLTPGTLYYYRGYATNSTGTAYSGDKTFTTQGKITVTASSISADGLYAITVYISNPNPKSLRLRAEYGEGNFGLKSNTFSFDDRGRGVAAFTALRPGQTYQYRLFDTTGVLTRSDTYSFSTSGGGYGGSSGFSGYYPSYLVSSTSTTGQGSVGTSSSSSFPSSTSPSTSSSSISTMPLPATPPPAPATTPTPRTGSGSASGSTPSSPTSVSGSSPTPTPAGSPSPGSRPPSPAGAPRSSPTPTPAGPNTGLVPCGKTGQPECTFKDIMDLINKVIRFVLVDLAVPIAAIMFFYAGVLMVTSGGSTESRSRAKAIFTNTILGLVFIAGAWLIIRTILSVLGYDGAWIFDKF